jgi:hypothetical protein
MCPCHRHCLCYMENPRTRFKTFCVREMSHTRVFQFAVLHVTCIFSAHRSSTCPWRHTGTLMYKHPSRVTGAALADVRSTSAIFPTCGQRWPEYTIHTRTARGGSQGFESKASVCMTGSAFSVAGMRQPEWLIQECWLMASDANGANNLDAITGVCQCMSSPCQSGPVVVSCIRSCFLTLKSTSMMIFIAR